MPLPYRLLPSIMVSVFVSIVGVSLFLAVTWLSSGSHNRVSYTIQSWNAVEPSLGIREF